MAQKKLYDEYSLADLFREMELKLIASQKRTLAKHEAWEKDLGFQWEQWQLAKLRSLQGYLVNNRKIVNSYSNEIDDVIESMLKTSYGTAYNDHIKLMEEFNDDFILDEIPEENFFGINDKKLNAVIDEMQGTFSNSKGLVLRKMEDVYRETVNGSVIEMAAGTTTINKSVDDVIKDFLRKGIDCITYKDGKRVNIASYAEMYLRTANQRASLVAQGKVRDELGVYTVIVTQHAMCCEACLKWQGKVLIDDVFTSLSKDDAQQMSLDLGYPLLSTAIEEGLFHPNCRHSISTWFQGKSSVPVEFTDEQKERALSNYFEEQRQRTMEAELRRWKRIKEGSLDSENIAAADKMVKHYKKQLRDHIKANPHLRRRYWRERIEPMLEGRQNELVQGFLPDKPYEDVTQQWIDAVDQNRTGSVIKNDYFEIEEMRYDSSNAKLDMKFGNEEMNVASWLKDTFHEDVQLVPRVAPLGKTFIKTPDYQFRNEFWDLKTIEGSGKETIVNRIKKAEGQASNFVINLSQKSNLSNEMVERQIKYLYRMERYNYVDKIIVSRNGIISLIAQKKR